MPYNKAATIHTSKDTGVTVFAWQKKKPDANQMALNLDECKPTAPTLEAFQQAADETLSRMPLSFWFSEFRQAVPVDPPSDAMWGTYSRRMGKLGYARTNERRKSPLKNRRSGEETKWCRAEYGRSE